MTGWQPTLHRDCVPDSRSVLSGRRRLPARPVLVAALLALLVNVDPAAAQSSAEKGQQIASAALDADRNFQSYTAGMVMILRNKAGQENRRNLRIRSLEVQGDGDKLLFVFDSPPDVKGTAFLIHGHRTKADDQWLYLPALKRVKRISSSNRSGSFLGSELAYEDMSKPELEKFTYSYLRDEPCGSQTCTVTEFVPTEKGSGYVRMLYWHDTGEYRTHRIEYYDRKNAHLKTLTHNGYKRYAGQFWRPSNSNMVNHVTGKSTELQWNDYKFKAGLKDREFSKTGLRRIR